MAEIPGTLYVVSTPIGHLEDMTFRAVRILKESEIIAAEDTRHTRKLLNHFGIHSVLTSYHDHNKEEKTSVLLQKLRSGVDIVLVCDAGTPAISDPGLYLIRSAIGANVPVVPIPGPTALITALSVSGAPTDRFVFEGFAPRKSAQRRRWLNSLLHEERTIVFYESPHRVAQCLQDIHAVLGDRSVTLARELTKFHEEFQRGKVSEILARVKGRPVRGEITLIIEGAEKAKKRSKADRSSDQKEGY